MIYPSVASTNASATGQYYEVVHTAAMKTAIAGMGGNAIVDPTPEGAGFPYACTPRWAPALALIKSVQLIVGSSVVDTLSTVVMSVWKELTDAWAWVDGICYAGSRLRVEAPLYNLLTLVRNQTISGEVQG